MRIASADGIERRAVERPGQPRRPQHGDRDQHAQSAVVSGRSGQSDVTRRV